MSLSNCIGTDCNDNSELAFLDPMFLLFFSALFGIFWIHLKSILLVVNAMKKSAPTKLAGLTISSSNRFTFQWNIENFSRYCNDDIPNWNFILFSPTFGPFSNDPLQFRLDLRPRDPDDEDNDYVGLYLNLVSCEKPYVNVLYSFSILDKKGFKCNVFGNHSPEKGKFYPGDTQGFRSFVDRDDLLDDENDWLVNGTLTLYCEIMHIDAWSFSGQFKDSHINNGSFDFSKLLNSDELSDVVLLAGGKEFPAYKGILATQSPVLSKMFDVQDLVELPDVESDVAHELLKFIYTGKCPAIGKLAAKLLPLAFQLKMDSLERLCEETLCSQLSISTVLSFLKLAEEFRAKKLKQEALAFYAKQTINTIRGTKDAQLLIETFRKMVLK